MNASFHAPRIRTTNGNKVVDGAAWNSVDQMSTNAFQRQAIIVSSLHSLVIRRDNLLGSSNNDNMSRGKTESSCSTSCQITNSQVSLFGDGGDTRQKIVSLHGLATKLGGLRLIWFCQHLTVKVNPVALSLQVIHKSDLIQSH